MATDAWGVDDGYVDAAGRWHTAPAETVAGIHRSMGGDVHHERPTGSVRIVHQGAAEPLTERGTLTLEDGTELAVQGSLPPDLPLGYHQLQREDRDEGVGDGDPTTLIVSPGRCHLPDDLRAWGIAAELYAARSSRSWGIGDLGDLGQLAELARRAGAGVLALNPLHAALPLAAQEPSPYFPSSRRWANPLYLRVHDLPGATGEPGLDELARLGEALNGERRIDRDAVYRLKLDAFERLWRRFPGDPAFERFLADHGTDLQQYATFCALTEHHGGGWSRWPAEHRRPDTAAVSSFAGEHHDRVRFHAWLQWLLDGQLAASGAADLVIADLAVGVNPDGADAWAWQDELALDVGVGAPPDQFNTQGQDWGLPPFVPWRLRSRRYEPFVQTIRATMRRARGIRIDHVAGLFRLFWIPRGAGPGDGTYVRYDARELLDIVALESVRAGTFVVGEDLGTVEEATRSRLAAAGVLSYRLLWFEPGNPVEYPRQALAAVSTHDLPTIAGLWTGADLEAQEALDLHPNTAGTADMRTHLAALTSSDDDRPVEDVIVDAHRKLAEAPSALMTATLDDALAVTERPNMPGTVDGWPNWSIALPVPIDDLAEHPLVRRVVEAINKGRDGPTTTTVA